MNNNWQQLLTPQEKQIYLDYFKKVDSDNKGIVLQEEAVSFLQQSDIPQNILSQFWEAVDNDKKGFLTEQEFCSILKLIACAQHGAMAGDPILSTSVPLPQFNGQEKPARLPPRNNSTDLITTEERLKYINLFQSLGPVDGVLNGQAAKNVFVRSNLPPAKLQAIWDLANTRKSGALNQTEFIIAMHYIERTMKEAAQLPPTLPASIYASASGHSISSPLVRQNTLQINRVPLASPVFKGSTLTNFEISPDEYAKYKAFFDQLTTYNSGYVSGADAVVFFKHSKLPESDLARIWDLADTNSTGQLSEQEFAMAMHMINRRLAGGDIPNSQPVLGAKIEPQQQQQQQQQQQNTVDLLGLSSDFDNTFTPSQSHQQLQQQPYSTLSRSQSVLQSNISNETSRSQQAQSQIQSESQAIAELEKQVQQQKEKLEKIKHAADEAEKQLESEKKKKEKLIEELQMYRQEIKHFKIRAENAQDEIEQIKNDTKELEEEKSKLSSPKSSLSPKANPQKDVFTLSSTGGGVFAKVHDDHSSVTASSPESVHSMPTQKIFDPFAGFKASSQSATSSPTATLNRLKEGAGSRMSATIDISEIESKFPDLNTMEQSFAAAAPPPSPPAGSSPQPTKQQIPEIPSKQTPDLTTSLTQETKPKNESVSKYGFDVSAFESPSTTTNTNNLFGLSVKDDLSSIFESPSANSNASATTSLSVFDDVFSSSTAKDNNTSNTTSFEDVFFKK